MRPLILIVALVSCRPYALTPPARMMPMSPAQIPARSAWDAQLDGGLVTGAQDGPGIALGNLRYRRGVTDDVALVADAGYAAAFGSASTDLHQGAGMVRIGGQITQPSSIGDVAAFGGVGGGYAPAAGAWTSVDVGGALTGTHRFIRPFLVGDAFGSLPWATQVFECCGSGIDAHMLRLPPTVGLQVSLGLEIGPRARAFVIGLLGALMQGAATDVQDAKGQAYLALGIGFRFGN